MGSLTTHLLQMRLGPERFGSFGTVVRERKNKGIISLSNEKPGKTGVSG